MRNKIILLMLSTIALCGNTMINYYDKALSHSYIVQEAKYNIDASRYNIDEANSANDTNINWSISKSRTDDRSEIEIEDNTYNQSTYNLTLNKPIYSIDNDLSLKKAKIEEKIEKLKYQKSLQTFSIDFLDKYFTVYKEKKYLQFAIKNQRFANKLFKRVKKLFKLNMISEIELLKIKANLTEANENLELSKLKFEKAKNLFKILLRISKLDNFIDFSIKSLNSLSVKNSNNYDNSFDIKLINLEILLIKEDMKVLKNWYYPTVNFNINYSNLHTGDPTTYDLEQTSGKIVLSGNLYKGDAIRSSQKKALALLSAKTSKKDFMYNAIHIKVSENILELKNNIAQFNIIKDKLNQTILEFKVLGRKNKIGLTDFSKTMQAQNKILELETQKIDKIIEAFKLYANIQYEFIEDKREVINKFDRLLQNN